MPSITIKLSSGLTKPVEVPSFDITVSEMKALAAPIIDIPADQQRPVFKGKMLKDADKLSTLGIAEGSAVHVVRGRGAAAESATPAQTTSPSSTSANAEVGTPVSAPQPAPTTALPNPYASLFGGGPNEANNTGFGAWGGGAEQQPANNNPMAGINPQMLQQMMGGMGMGGGMGGADQAAAMQMMNNPQMMNMVSQMVAQNPQFVLQALNSNPMFQNMAPQQREMLTQIMSNPQMFQQMMQLSSAFGGGMGAAGGNSNNMNAMGGAPQPQVGGVPNNLFGGGGAGMFGIPPVANPREAYATQLSQLAAMGFPNEQANIAALQMSQGNVEFAIERLLSGGM